MNFLNQKKTNTFIIMKLIFDIIKLKRHKFLNKALVAIFFLFLKKKRFFSEIKIIKIGK